MIKFNNLVILLAFILVANCSQHSVKFGKKCTVADNNQLQESSYIWFVSEDALKDFDKRINKRKLSEVRAKEVPYILKVFNF